jgi:hypothetical protein
LEANSAFVELFQAGTRRYTLNWHNRAHSTLDIEQSRPQIPATRFRGKSSQTSNDIADLHVGEGGTHRVPVVMCPMRATLFHNPSAGHKADKDDILAAMKLADFDVRYVSVKQDDIEQALEKRPT